MGKMNLKRNDIIAYYPKNWFDNMICFYSGKYNHVAIVRDPDIEIEAKLSGVSLFPIRKNIYFDVYRLSPYQSHFNSKAAWDWALDCVRYGLKYDKLGLLGYLFRKPIFNSPNKYFCSEFIDRFFEIGGIDLVPELQSWNIGPTELVNSNKLQLVHLNLIIK